MLLEVAPELVVDDVEPDVDWRSTTSKTTVPTVLTSTVPKVRFR